VNDQARDLRALAPRAAEHRPPEGPPVVVLGSGKGGVGKSVLAVAIAAALARRGRRTLLLDGAQNQGNLHILLGIRPALPLTSVLAGEADPEDLLVPVTDGLTLLPADSGAESLYGLGAVDRARLHRRLSGLYDGFDAVVVDGGSGIESAVRAAGIRASRLAVVAVPEPASLADAYALIKIVSLQVPSVPIEVMVNRASADEEGRVVVDRLRLAAERFLRRDVGWLGCVPEDEALRRAARRPGALLETRLEAIEAIAERLGDRAGEAEVGAAPATGTGGRAR
jgi:flagellar biosynthesis protein FlhG